MEPANWKRIGRRCRHTFPSHNSFQTTHIHCHNHSASHSPANPACNSYIPESLQACSNCCRSHSIFRCVLAKDFSPFFLQIGKRKIQIHVVTPVIHTGLNPNNVLARTHSDIPKATHGFFLIWRDNKRAHSELYTVGGQLQKPRGFGGEMTSNATAPDVLSGSTDTDT